MNNSHPQNDDRRQSLVKTSADDTRRTRRGMLGSIGVATIATLAGCTSDGEGADSTDDTDDTQAGDDGTDSPEDDGETGSTAFGQVVTFANTYEFVVKPTDEDSELIGRFDGEHLYWRMEDDSDLVEMYYIGTDIYFVENEQECILLSSGQDMPGAEPIDPDTTDPEVRGGTGGSMVNTGTDQIQGDEVYVYEHENEDEDGVMYVHVDSGLPRRFESADAVVDWFYDDIAPVEPPDVECEELPEF